MMAPLMYLFFSGLIVFVPSPNKDSMTAYFVDDHRAPQDPCNHVPSLVIHGKATIVENPGALCGPTAHGDISCQLSADTKVNLDTEKNATSIPGKPPGSLPFIPTAANGGSPRWLVRLANVSPLASVSKLPSEIMSLSDGDVSIGWQNAYTCAFDEGGEGIVHPMAFVGSHGRSDHAQAVAETVMFESRLHWSTELIVTKDEEQFAVISMDCKMGVCPILEFSNNVSDKCKELQHFGHFYDFAADQSVDRMHPEPIQWISVPASQVTFKCSSAIGLGLPDPTGEIAALRTTVDNFLKRKPANIIICPPVVMGQ
jgi:hypothetical protein